MSALDTSPRLVDPDGLFEALVDAHRDLDPAASRRLDARIVLLLANHIGNVAVVREAIAAARAAGGGHQDAPAAGGHGDPTAAVGDGDPTAAAGQETLR